MRRLCGYLIAAALLGSLIEPVDAKPLGKIFRQAGLSPQDIEIMTQTEKSLYETSSPQPGRVVSWFNPEGTRNPASIGEAFAEQFVRGLLAPDTEFDRPDPVWPDFGDDANDDPDEDGRDV